MRIGVNVVLALLCLTSTGDFADGLRQPNIVFILADDLGWNDVSFHGYNEIPTPNINKLAREGVILHNYYAQHLCTPSRAAMMTGKYPIRLGLQHRVLGAGEKRGLDLQEKLLPQYLKELGYSTHLVGKWHLGYYKKQFTPTFRGFDSFFGFYNGFVDYYTYQHISKVPPGYGGFDMWDNLEPALNCSGHYLTELLTQKAVEKIQSQNSGQPYFLLLSHLAPHFANADDPVQAPPKYTDRFPHISHIGRRKHAGTVSALDDSVGVVIRTLERKGMLNNTVVLFASDNGAIGPERERILGPPFGYGSNWPLRGAKTSQMHFALPSFYKQKANPLAQKLVGMRCICFVPNHPAQKNHHFPCFRPELAKRLGAELFESYQLHLNWLTIPGFRWEGGVRATALVWSQLLEHPQRVSKGLYHVTDWFPTLYALAGGTAELSGLDGQNIWPSISKDLPSPRSEILLQADPVWDEYVLRWNNFKLVLGSWENNGVRLDGWYEPVTGVNMSYATNTSSTVACIADQPTLRPCRAREGPCLFDIESDPCEQTNVASVFPDVTHLMLQKIKGHNSTAKPSMVQSVDIRAKASLHNGLLRPWLIED